MQFVLVEVIRSCDQFVWPFSCLEDSKSAICRATMFMFSCTRAPYSRPKVVCLGFTPYINRKV